MVISIHIPKTGGSSFGDILKDVYGDRLWINYDFQWNAVMFNKAFIPSGTQCIHGHFEFTAFDDAYSESSKITWLRDPVDRTISLYHHIMTRPDQENDLIMEIYKSRPSLVEFSRIPWVSNQAMNYLKGAQPLDFKFIGFLEHFEESLGLCAKLLNWNKIPKPVWINRGVGKEKSGFPDEVRELIRKDNMEEYEWREEAKRLFLDEVR